jgi:hypothetical protein
VIRTVYISSHSALENDIGVPLPDQGLRQVEEMELQPSLLSSLITLQFFLLELVGEFPCLERLALRFRQEDGLDDLGGDRFNDLTVGLFTFGNYVKNIQHLVLIQEKFPDMDLPTYYELRTLETLLKERCSDLWPLKTCTVKLV